MDSVNHITVRFARMAEPVIDRVEDVGVIVVPVVDYAERKMGCEAWQQQMSRRSAMP